MADIQYVTSNRLTHKAEAGQERSRQQVLMVGVPIALVSLLYSGWGCIIVSLVVGIVYVLQRGDGVVLAGAEGEQIALSVLSNLPDGFTIFNQVDVPNPRSNTGVNEADLIVCGPDALFVIEIKHNNGVIVCDESLREWSITKVGRGGTAYNKTMRNPVSQTKKLVWLIGEYLKDRNAKPWIQGIVIFTNPNVTLDFNGELSVPVLCPNDAMRYILDLRTRSRQGSPESACAEIINLKRAAVEGGGHSEDGVR